MRRDVCLVLLVALAVGCGGERERSPITRDGGSGAVRDAGDDDRDGGQVARDGGQVARDGGDVRDGGTPVMLPDPASGPPNGAILFGGAGWDGLPFDNATPMTAVPLGTVEAIVGGLYVQDDTNAWFVFIAGTTLTNLEVELFVQPDVIQQIHLHEADNQVLGAMVTPTNCGMTPGSFLCAWDVTPGRAYALEIMLVRDQFF